MPLPSDASKEAEMMRANWMFARRNLVHMSGPSMTLWRDQYRAFALTALVSKVAYALIRCDTHEFMCWIPDNINEEYEDETFSVKWLKKQTRRINSYKKASENISVTPPPPPLPSIFVDVAGSINTLSFTTTTTIKTHKNYGNDKPAPYDHTTENKNKTQQPKETLWLYSTGCPQRRHNSPSSCRRHNYLETTEHVIEDMSRVCKLARAGVAFCVHSVHVFAGNFKLAKLDAVKSHVDALMPWNTSISPRTSTFICTPKEKEEKLKTERKGDEKDAEKKKDGTTITEEENVAAGDAEKLIQKKSKNKMKKTKKTKKTKTKTKKSSSLMDF